MAEYKHIVHTFPPVYDSRSKILILGSLPSVRSRETGFYYGHPRNRFWKVLASLCGCSEPVTIEEKKSMLLQNHIAVWDVIKSCDIIGSGDSSIKNVIPADIGSLLQKTQIKRIYANGSTAGKLYKKHIQSQTDMDIIVLPSTSPANAVRTLENLIQCWSEALQ